MIMHEYVMRASICIKEEQMRQKVHYYEKNIEKNLDVGELVLIKSLLKSLLISVILLVTNYQ
jgi:hypothetical protein